MKKKAMGVMGRMSSKSCAGGCKDVASTLFPRKKDRAAYFACSISTLSGARDALARAHFAANPDSVRRAIYEKYPQLMIKKD